MWDLKNRSVIALISALTGCIFLYNVWGPILFLTVSLIFTTYVCYCLIINDSLLSRQAFLLFDYCKQYFFEFTESVIDRVCRYTREFLEATSDRFRQRYLTESQSRMERRRGSQYQLSSDSFPIRRNSSSFESIAQLSPITKNSQNVAVLDNINNPRDNFYRNPGHFYGQSSFVAHKHTSTSKFPVGEEEVENQTFKVSPDNRRLSKRVSPTYRENGATFQEENATYFAGDSTPSSFYTHSKLQTKMDEQKPVSVAEVGPLSMSTRYNIDPKVYNDVSSPGLTTRLTKYVTEANNKLIHLPLYNVGQFPKVNLSASPVPVINAKSMKTRTPVTVRIAPPDTVRYSPPLKRHILTDVYSSDNSCSSSNVHTLRDISLKRHASRDDVTSDLPKKQRTGSFGREEIEMQDETTQKRSRDDSTRSEEDISPQSQTTRPTKRTKTPSCYDIINSLSSSKHVSGVKRKARDFSRSGTPDFEKHFKSLECVQSAGAQTLAEFPIEVTPISYQKTYQMSEKTYRDACNLVRNKSPNTSPLKGILKGSNTIAKGDKQINRKHSNLQSSEKDRPVEPTSSELAIESTKLTHKLFMRAEPERNEKLRMLVEEQGNIRAKFTTDDVEEIKKEDIANMRQTSMKARLQSMFDAISGRATSRINPDVVIQAEEVNVVEPVACPVTCATLNSSTTTTNINTTPISTSAVVLGPGITESITKSPKHVSFDLSNKETSSNAKNVPFGSTVERKINNVQTSSVTDTKSNVDSQVTSTVSNTSISNSINSNVPHFDFAKPKASLIKPATSGVLPVTVNNSPTSVAPPVTTSIFRNVLASTSTSPSVSTTPTAIDAKIIASESKPKINVPSQVSQTSPVIVNSMVTSVKGKEQSIASPIISLPSVGIVSKADSTTSSSVNLPAPLLTFGDKTRTDPPLRTFKPEGFTFNSSGNVSLSGGTFGASTVSRQTTINNNVTTTNTNNSIANTAPSTGFESTAKTAAKTTASTFGQSTYPTFTFRSASTVPTISTSDKTGFSFGNATNATIGNSNAGLFAIGNSNASPSFGVPTTSSSSVIQFTPSSGSNIFANSTSTTSSTPSIFGAVTSNQQPIFGAPSLNTTTATFALPKSTVAPVFGSSMTTTASAGFASTNSLPIFSNTGNASSTPSTTSLPTFGSTAGTSTSEISSNVFSVSNSTTTTSNIFNQASSGTSFRSGSGAFGSSNPMLFGSQVTTTSTFGSSSSSTVSGSGFGTTSASSNSGPIASGFISQNQNKEGVQSSGSQSFGGGNSIFGRDNVAPAFGTSNSVSGVSFDSSATHNSSTPTFGTVAGPSTSGPANFGDTNKILPFGVQSPAFGATTASTPAFGNASTNNENNTSGIFTFGGNQKPSTQQNSFSFGGNNNTVTTCASSSFQFGSTITNTNSATGFNFSAPSTTPSINFGASSSTATFNASAPGMFSIGSGSTAPRSRNTRSSRKLR